LAHRRRGSYPKYSRAVELSRAVFHAPSPSANTDMELQRVPSWLSGELLSNLRPTDSRCTVRRGMDGV